MLLSEVKLLPHVDKVRIHSLESNLYQVSILVGEDEHYVFSAPGKFLRSHNKLDLLAQFEGMSVGSTVLCHQSAYDEMVGQPLRDQANLLEVPISMQGR
jgi:hypothetical protein